MGQNTAEVIDFDQFRRQREDGRRCEPPPFAPMLVWVPVWVMLPQQTVRAY
jgi:hypothetical protein